MGRGQHINTDRDLEEVVSNPRAELWGYQDMGEEGTADVVERQENWTQKWEPEDGTE